MRDSFVSKFVYETEENDDTLEKTEATRFRALAARASYLSQDRPDMMFASKEVCREMAVLTRSSWSRLKKLARYLLDHPRGKWVFHRGSECDASVVKVFSDSDWAGCKVSRKSTSGGVLVIWNCCIRCWSSTQAFVATSSGELRKGDASPARCRRVR